MPQRTHVRVLLARLALAVLGTSEQLWRSTLERDLHVRRVLRRVGVRKGDEV